MSRDRGRMITPSQTSRRLLADSRNTRGALVLSDKRSNIATSHRLARNILWNLFGTGAPLLIAIFAIPLLVEGLGVERFGVLTLAWVVIGYFSLFDLGLGRAVTKLVAEKLGAGLEEEIPPLIWTAMSLMLGLGAIGGLLAAALTPWLVGSVLEVPAELEAETRVSFYLLAASIPIVIGTSGLRGVLEARQLFRFVNIIRIPLGLATFLGPLAVLPFSGSLVPVVTVLALSRLAAALAYGALCLHVEPRLRHSIGIGRTSAKTLLGFGGWITVSNVVSPLMLYLDRFLIGAMVSMTAVAFYAIPYEVVTKLLIIPVALMGVMFPAFSAALVSDRERATRLFLRTNNYIFIAIFPVVLIGVTLASEGLTLWLGEEFADNSTVVLQLLAVGVFLNSQGQVPFGMVQGAGRADWTAKLHLLELVFYLPLLWLLLDAFGIVGAAVAWGARMGADTLLLFILSSRLLPEASRPTCREVIGIVAVFLALGVGAVISGLAVKVAFLLTVLSLFAITAWFGLLKRDERELIRNRLHALPLFS